jgi:hypothetical protein
VGTAPQPKSEEEQARRDEILEELEDSIKDAILTGSTPDPVLSVLLEITINSVTTGRPLFDNPLKEPAFYRRKFYPWVKEGIEEYRKVQAGDKQEDEE